MSLSRIQNALGLACYILLFSIILLAIGSRLLADQSLFNVSAITDYFEGTIGSDGTTFSVANTLVCERNKGASESNACGRGMAAVNGDFSGRVSLPEGARIRMRYGPADITQIYVTDTSAKVRLDSISGENIEKYISPPVRFDIPQGARSIVLMNIAGEGARIGALSTRDTSGSPNALRSGTIEIYGIGVWWRLAGDPTSPVSPDQLFHLAEQNLQLGDSVRFSEGRHRVGSSIPFWATIGVVDEGTIEISLRAIADAAIVERYGGSGLTLRKTWLDGMFRDPLFQILWSVFGTFVALASIQFITGKNQH